MPPSSQQAYASLQDYSKKRRSTQDIQKEAETKYNVSGISARLSGLRTLVGNLENSLENVDPSVRGRNSGGFVTEGQNQALINREQQPILGSLSKQQRALGDTQEQFSLSSALAGDLARSLRADDETGYQRMLDQYNASVAQEQAAEAKRQFDMQMELERKKAAKTSEGYDIGAILKQLGIGGDQSQSADKPSLDSIFGSNRNRSRDRNVSQPTPAPTQSVKPGYNAAALAYAPIAPYILGAGAIRANEGKIKNKLSYVANNKAGYAKGLASKIKGLF